MAVLERTYKRYEGRLSPEWSRFLIIPRHAYVDVFRSKLFTAFFALSFLYPLVCSILIYLHYNTTVLGVQKLHLDQLLPIDASFFKFYVVWQGITGFFLVMLVAPVLMEQPTDTTTPEPDMSAALVASGLAAEAAAYSAAFQRRSSSCGLGCLAMNRRRLRCSCAQRCSRSGSACG